MREIIKNILNKMQGILDDEQLEVLEQTLEGELNRQVEKQKESNEKLLDDFIKSKAYEDCSSATLEQYKRENEKFIQ